MKKRDESQWRTLFKQHDDSGLTAAAFCRSNKLCPKYFSKRKRDLNWPGTQSKPSPFIQLKPQLSTQVASAPIKIQSGTTLVELPISIEATWLAQLLKTLA